MNLRGQVLLGSLLLAVLPLALAIPILRDGVQQRLTEVDARRVEDQLRLVREDLEQRDLRLEQALQAITATLAADNRFRLALIEPREDLQSYLVDVAGRQMSLADLDMLQIETADGRVLSSGHYREAFGDAGGRLARVLDQAPAGKALLTVRTPAGEALMLGRARAFELAGQKLNVIAGLRLEADALTSLSRDEDLTVAVVWAKGRIASHPELAERIDRLPPSERRAGELEYLLRTSGQVVRTQTLPLIDDGDTSEAVLLAVHDRATLHRLLRDLDWRLGLILALAVGVAVILAIVLAGRISRPLRELADRTEGLDLDRLDVEFRSDRRDEVGRLARLLNEMIGRLRRDVTRLQAAEHRATLGEVARQVNHDIRNGLTPLRNVLRHLDEVAENDPQELSAVFRQRKATLDGGLAYLEELAAHYSRLSPGRQAQRCRLDEVAAEALAAPSVAPRTKLVNTVPTTLPPVLADPVSLRRIFDNLVRNAIESLPDGRGTVQIDARLEEDEMLEEMRIVVEVSDDGCGIEPENLDRIFNDFFTTREDGTGLGLSNVRRLAADCGASVRVASRPGEGSAFTLSFPVSPTLDPES